MNRSRGREEQRSSITAERNVNRRQDKAIAGEERGIIVKPNPKIPMWMLYLLAVNVASEFPQLDRKTPVTAGLIAANTLVYLRPGVLDDLLPSLSEICLQPYLVIQNRDLTRLFLSAFYYVDESHLVYNMLSLLWKGVQLERMMGSTEFASMVAVLLGLSHGIVVVLAKVLATFFDYPYPLTSEFAVGFSSVLFALKVVLNSKSPNFTNVHGMLVPARYAAWVELPLIQLFVPGVSFLSHLGGIFAGFLYLRLRGFSLVMLCPK